MKIRPGILACGSIVLLCLAAPATAQYLRITTDNPTDNTRLRASGTTILTLTLDTNHDRNGSLQSCNSHTAANCGRATTTQPLDMFSYTLALKTVGGTVTWGTFTAADAAYTDTSPQIQSNVEVEINKARPGGTVTPAGLATLGTIPLTPASGAPRIDVQIGASAINPSGFGTGFGTSCDGFFFPNTYVVGDPSDPCGAGNGIAGDWFDWDGAGSIGDDNQPVISAPSAVSGAEGTTFSVTATATDADAGDVLTITATGVPPFGTFSTIVKPSPTTATINFAPGFGDAGNYTIQWTVNDGHGGTASRTTSLVITNTDRGPVLDPIANMTFCAGSNADQAIRATDADADAITFTFTGPTFMSVTSNAQAGTVRTGNIHLAPSFATTGSFSGSVTASSGSPALSDSKSFVILITGSCGPPVLAQPANMTVPEGGTADQTLNATDPGGSPITFSKVTGPTFMTVTTTNRGTGTATGNIHLAPGFASAGVYNATVRASNGLLVSDRTLTITVCNGCARAPLLNPIANMTVTQTSTANQTITASDPDGNALTFSKTAGPTFMTVTTTVPGTGTASGNIHLAPGTFASGTYGGTVTVSDGALSDSKSFTITVTDFACRPPSLAQPANMTVIAGSTADQTFTATDPDGSAITFTSSGPTFMTRTDNPQSGATRTGNIHLAPSPTTTSGTFAASVTATVGGACPGSDSKSFTITVCPSGPPPLLAQPANMSVDEGATADQILHATDPDGDPLTFTKVSGPTFMTVTTTSPGTGTATGNVHLAPDFHTMGIYGASIAVSDGNLCGTDTKSFSITVRSGNRCPTANAGGPYSSLAGVPVNFDGTASSDPDGNPLTYAWDFDASDGITVDGVGAMVSHVYATAGTFTVTLTVTDNGGGNPAQVCSNSVTTTATIAAA